MPSIEEPHDDVVKQSAPTSSETSSNDSPNGSEAPSMFSGISNAFNSTFASATNFFSQYWKAITAGILTVAATAVGIAYAVSALKSSNPVFAGPLLPVQSRTDLDPNAAQTPDTSNDEEIAKAAQAQEYEEQPQPKATATDHTNQRTNQRRSRR